MSSLSVVLPMVMLVVVLIPENCHAVLPRRPWITKQPATVLDLQCEVPWEAVKGAYRLDIGFGEATSDESVYAYYLLSPGHEQLIITGLKKHTMAEASNTTDQNGPVLSIRMPITKHDEAQYFCLVHYGPENIRIYSVNVGRSFLNEPREQWNGSFFVRASPADNVTVTWHIAPSKPVSMEINRVHLGLRENGSWTTYSKFLVSTFHDKVQDKKAGTLLAKVLSTPDQLHNYTVSIYVQSEFCFPNCSYRCLSVTSCSESDSAVCQCEGMIEPNVIKPNVTICEKCEYRGYQGGIGAFAVLLPLLIFTLVIVFYHHHKGKMCDFQLFNKAFCCPNKTESHNSANSTTRQSVATSTVSAEDSEAASLNAHSLRTFGVTTSDVNPDDVGLHMHSDQTSSVASGVRSARPTTNANSRAQAANGEDSDVIEPFLRRHTD